MICHGLQLPQGTWPEEHVDHHLALPGLRDVQIHNAAVLLPLLLGVGRDLESFVHGCYSLGGVCSAY